MSGVPQPEGQGSFLQQCAQRPTGKTRTDEKHCALGREREGAVEHHSSRAQAGGETREKRKPVRIRIGLKVRQHALKATLDAFRDDGAAERVDAWDRPGAAVGKAHEPAARKSRCVAARQASALTDGIGHVDERQRGLCRALRERLWRDGEVGEQKNPPL